MNIHDPIHVIPATDWVAVFDDGREEDIVAFMVFPHAADDHHPEQNVCMKAVTWFEFDFNFVEEAEGFVEIRKKSKPTPNA